MILGHGDFLGEVIAVKMLGPLKEEAKKRQQFHGGTAPGKSLPPVLVGVNGFSGEATRQAAKIVGVGEPRDLEPDLFKGGAA